MSLLGNGAMVFWHDVAPGTDADYRDWHAHEHISERVGIPGFLRGRRCASVDGGQQCTDDRVCLGDEDCPCLRCRLDDDGVARCLPR